MRLISHFFCERGSTNMSSTADGAIEGPSISGSSNTENPRVNPPFLSRREFKAQCPDLEVLWERYLRGEINFEDYAAGLKALRDHLSARIEREEEFADRERRGEVSTAELQREYGWTDEEMQKSNDLIKLESKIIRQNIARCSSRSVLYRNAGGH